MNLYVEGYVGAALEIYLFVLISSKIKNIYQINFDNNISYYWLCFTVMTGMWEMFYILNYRP